MSHKHRETCQLPEAEVWAATSLQAPFSGLSTVIHDHSSLARLAIQIEDWLAADADWARNFTSQQLQLPQLQHDCLLEECVDILRENQSMYQRLLRGLLELGADLTGIGRRLDELEACESELGFGLDLTRSLLASASERFGPPGEPI